MKKSKTQEALELIQKGMAPYAAAQQVGISASAVYRALERRQDKELCPCCGQVVREGFAVNREVLKDEGTATGSRRRTPARDRRG